jgi:hypothetical protein
MYTAEIKRKTLELENKRILVDVEYQKDGVRISSEQFIFSLDITLEQIKQRINSELKRFIAIDANLATITEGVVDLSTVPTGTQTQAEKDRDNWFRDFQRLEALDKLNKLGALKTAHVADLDALRVKVADNFKKAYIADM